MSQYPPPPPSYGAYDQPPPPGFGYPPNQGPYYPQPGYPQQPTTCPPAPGGYYPGQPATQTIDKMEKSSSPKKERETLVREMNVFTVEAGAKKYVPRIPLLHSKKYKSLDNQQSDEEETPIATELGEKRKSYSEDLMDGKCQPIATQIADGKKDNCTSESRDKKYNTAAPEFVDGKYISRSPELDDGKHLTTAPEQVDEKYLPTAPELNDEMFDNSVMEWTSTEKYKPTAPKLDCEMYQLSAGGLAERKSTSVSSTNDLTVSTIGHGKYRFSIGELMGSQGQYHAEQNLNNVTEFSDGKYKPTAPGPVTGKYQLSAVDLVDRKFTSSPNVDWYESSYGSMGKQYTYPITEMERRSNPYPAEDYYAREQMNDVRNQKQDDDGCNCTEEDCFDCLRCCEALCYCLMCLVQLLEVCKN